MAVMTEPQVDADVPATRPFTVDDLEAMPDDGRRYELIDGMLIVSPAPSLVHQVCAVGLWRALDRRRPKGFVIVPAPFDFRTSTDTLFQPDLLVASRKDLSPESIRKPLALVVEILSRSTRTYDRSLKKAAYEKLGVSSYWIVDPDEPSIQVFELDGGSYAEALVATGDNECVVERPYPVTVVPARLLDDLRD